MTEEKQPVIQSVFDQRVLEKNESFFLKALHELQGYKRELANVGPTSVEYMTHIGQDAEKSDAHREMLRSLTSSENILVGVLNSFDVLSEDNFF